MLCSTKSTDRNDGQTGGTAIVPHPPDATLAPHMASFCTAKCQTEERGTHVHTKNRQHAAGRSLCHGHSHVAGQSRQLPGHLVRTLPAALTRHGVYCVCTARPGSPLHWSFTNVRQPNVALLKMEGEKECYKMHLFYRGFKAFFSQAFMDICWGC